MRMSKSKKLKLIILAFAFSMAFISPIVIAEQTNSAAVPGSADDPLVTLSYITETLKPQIEAEILAAVSGADVSAILGALNDSTGSNNTINSSNSYTGNTAEPQQPPVQIGSESVTYELIELKLGQKILPESGSLELIVRQGSSAVALTPYEAQGVGDLTDGSEILNNQKIPVNHSLLIPRADGRSIQILSDTAYILVRGDYKIVD